MGDSELDAFKTFEADGWERQARTYGDVVGRVTRRLVDPLLDAAGVGPGRRVLDLATGPGYAAAAAVARGADVVAVDVAPAMVELARRLHPRLDVRQASAEALPFRDAEFDAAVSNFVVPHLGRHDRAVADLVRVLRPAAASLSRPGTRRTASDFRACSSRRSPRRARRDAGRAPPPYHRFRYADEGVLSELLDDAVLIDVQVRTVEFDHVVASPNELWDGDAGRHRTDLGAPAWPTQQRPGPGPRGIQSAGRGLPPRRPPRAALSVKLAAGRKPTAD